MMLVFFTPEKMHLHRIAFKCQDLDENTSKMERMHKRFQAKGKKYPFLQGLWGSKLKAVVP